MFTDVLVSLDLSTPSDVAVDAAAAVARRASLPLRLVTVASPGLDHDDDLADLGVVGAGVDIDPSQLTIEVVESNDVVPALLEATGPGGLLCVETRARGVIGSLVMGSVAAGVVAHAEVPVVLVGPNCKPGGSFETMQVCVDGPQTVAPLVAAASTWAGVVRSIRIVHVWVPGDARFGSEAEASACLEDAARQLRVAAACDVDAELLHGDMAPASLVADAEAHAVSISAVACRHDRALRRRVLGSVAMTIAHTTAAAVLVVPY